MKNTLLIRNGVSLTSGPHRARVVFLFVLFLASSSWSIAEAQQTPSAAQPSSTTPAATQGSSQEPGKGGAGKSEEEKEIERQEQSQRVMGTVPLFGVTSRQDAPALTKWEKFHLFAKQSFDPATVSIVGLQAGLSQAENEFPAYGQGADGFGKRFGASLADEVSLGFWSNYFYPILLKEDPRYFRLGHGKFSHRLLYSFAQEFVCHTDRGGRQFNYSNILGAFTTGFVSNIYYPGNSLIRTIPATATTPAIPVYEDDRGVGLTVSRTSIAIGYSTIGGVLYEFWPDVHNMIFHRHNKATAGQSSAQQPATEQLAGTKP